MLIHFWEAIFTYCTPRPAPPLQPQHPCSHRLCLSRAPPYGAQHSYKLCYAQGSCNKGVHSHRPTTSISQLLPWHAHMAIHATTNLCSYKSLLKASPPNTGCSSTLRCSPPSYDCTSPPELPSQSSPACSLICSLSSHRHHSSIARP